MSHRYSSIASLVLVVLLLGACQPVMPVETSAPPAVLSPLEEALTGKYAGATVTLAAVWPEAWGYGETFAGFEEETGIQVQYLSVDEVDPELHAGLRDGTGPDVVEFTTPLPMIDLAREGKVVDLTAFLPMDLLQDRYEPEWLEWARVAGPDGPITGGLFSHFFAKSVVWYPRAAFEAAGYQIPTTWDDLLALSDQIRSDGGTPWCIENGYWGDDTVGLTAAGWVQDIMLRTAPVDDYNRWITGELAFDSPQVKHAVELMADIWFKPGYGTGDRTQYNELFIGDLNETMMATPPGCWMLREPRWMVALYPLAGEFGVDYDFFNLPSIDPAYDQPIQVEGHFVTMFEDRPEVRALMEFYTTGAQLEAWIKMHEGEDLDVFFSPHKDAGLGPHTTERDRVTHEFFHSGADLRFSASDLMPLEVTNQFQKSMADYVAGTVDLDSALQQVDAAWPTD